MKKKTMRSLWSVNLESNPTRELLENPDLLDEMVHRLMSEVQEELRADLHAKRKKAPRAMPEPLVGSPGPEALVKKKRSGGSGNIH